VLLVDEIDKSDDEFEAFLLEILSDFQVSIPKSAPSMPSRNRSSFSPATTPRELSEALKRRCLHLFIPFPEPALERNIIRIRVPGISEKLGRQLVAFIQSVRKLDVRKAPSVSETIDWARVLLILHGEELNPDLVRDTLNIFLKFEEDIAVVTERLYQLTTNAVRSAGD